MGEALDLYAGLRRGVGYPASRGVPAPVRYPPRSAWRPRQADHPGLGCPDPDRAQDRPAVAAGLSTPQIAQNLFLTRRTTQTHISHILAKLGLRSRVEIARQAFNHDPDAVTTHL